jgi:hypothetical protein
MTFKKVFLIFLLSSMGVIAWVGYRAYTRTNPDLGKVKADTMISAENLIAAFEKDDPAANKQFMGKTIEVSGLLKKMTIDDMGDYSLAIGDSSSMAAVRCSVDSNHRADAALLRENTSVTVRGACTGFNKDELGLGAEVILNRCVIIKK